MLSSFESASRCSNAAVDQKSLPENASRDRKYKKIFFPPKRHNFRMKSSVFRVVLVSTCVRSLQKNKTLDNRLWCHLSTQQRHSGITQLLHHPQPIPVLLRESLLYLFETFCACLIRSAEYLHVFKFQRNHFVKKWFGIYEVFTSLLV
jgi:hypothetical protein